MDKNHLGDTDKQHKLYSEPLKPPLARKLASARRKNGRFDAIDRKHGHGAPSDCPLDVELRTILSALFCAVTVADWDIVFEGIALLQDAELKVRAAIEDDHTGV